MFDKTLRRDCEQLAQRIGHVDIRTAELHTLVRQRDATIADLHKQIKKLLTPSRHDRERNMRMLAIVNAARWWHEDASEENIRQLKEALDADLFAVWINHVDECLVCDAKSHIGTMWAWGIEDRGLCRECAARWRKDGVEGMDGKPAEIYGPTIVS